MFCHSELQDLKKKMTVIRENPFKVQLPGYDYDTNERTIFADMMTRSGAVGLSYIAVIGEVDNAYKSMYYFYTKFCPACKL